MGDKLKEAVSLQEFFSNELRSVIHKEQIHAHPASVQYLTELLQNYLKSESFFSQQPDGKLQDNTLALLYQQFIEGDTHTQKTTLKRLGDVCLMVTGFFSDSLNRKLVDVDYYFGMGGSAYWQLSHYPNTGKVVFQELSQKFKEFSHVLGEVSERGGISKNSDLLRLYERWLLTGNESLKKKLSRHGIKSPIEVNLKQKH